MMASVKAPTTLHIDELFGAPEVSPDALLMQSDKADESETEDEEVKMNCVNGIRGIDDSDMNTTEASDDDAASLASDDAEREASDRYVKIKMCRNVTEPFQLTANKCNFSCKRGPVGVVNFVKTHPENGRVSLLRPKAYSPKRPSPLSPHPEEFEDDAQYDSHSIGARGVAFSLGTPSAMSDGSFLDNESEESDDESFDAEESHDDVGQQEMYGSEYEEENNAEEDELSDILESLADRSYPTDLEKDISVDERNYFIGLIGDMEDRYDTVNVPKTKRVLSVGQLVSLLTKREDDSGTPPKRLKVSTEQGTEKPDLVDFSLGPAATARETSITRCLSKVRLESPFISSSSEEDEALDSQLRDELGYHEESSRENTPVPLLTPPGSPLTFEFDGDKGTFCEWPSNLAVDSALTSSYELRPMSPESLQDFEENEENRVLNHMTGKHDTETTTLTPMLRGIYVE